MLNETIKFNSPISYERSVTSVLDRIIDCTESIMHITIDREIGSVEWDITELDETVNIGLWFDDKKKLIDYDGVMTLPSQIVDFLTNRGYTIDKIISELL